MTKTDWGVKNEIVKFVIDISLLSFVALICGIICGYIIKNSMIQALLAIPFILIGKQLIYKQYQLYILSRNPFQFEKLPPEIIKYIAFDLLLGSHEKEERQQRKQSFQNLCISNHAMQKLIGSDERAIWMQAGYRVLFDQNNLKGVRYLFEIQKFQIDFEDEDLCIAVLKSSIEVLLYAFDRMNFDRNEYIGIESLEIPDENMIYLLNYEANRDMSRDDSLCKLEFVLRLSKLPFLVQYLKYGNQMGIPCKHSCDCYRQLQLRRPDMALIELANSKGEGFYVAIIDHFCRFLSK
jgi:hypothetical protein